MDSAQSVLHLYDPANCLPVDFSRLSRRGWWCCLCACAVFGEFTIELSSRISSFKQRYFGFTAGYWFARAIHSSLQSGHQVGCRAL